MGISNLVCAWLLESDCFKPLTLNPMGTAYETSGGWGVEEMADCACVIHDHIWRASPHSLTMSRILWEFELSRHVHIRKSTGLTKETMTILGNEVTLTNMQYQKDEERLEQNIII